MTANATTAKKTRRAADDGKPIVCEVYKCCGIKTRGTCHQHGGPPIGGGGGQEGLDRDVHIAIDSQWALMTQIVMLWRR